MSLSNRANNHLWDTFLTEALIEDCNNELKELEAQTEICDFSSDFENRLKKISRSIGRKENIHHVKNVIWKTAISVAAVFGMIFGGLLTQPTVYAAVQDIFVNVFNTHDKYEFSEDNAVNIENFDINKMPLYLPEGYELRNISFGIGVTDLTYRNDGQQAIYFTYSPADGSSISVDNERHAREIIRVNNQDYYFYRALEENDDSMMIWTCGGYTYAIIAQISDKEFIKIAESVK